MLNDAKVESACSYVRTCRIVRNSKKKKKNATIRDFHLPGPIIVLVNSTKRIMILFKELEFRGFRVSRFVGEMVLWMTGWGSQRNLEAPEECATLKYDRKGCTLDYLDGSLSFRFWGNRKKILLPQGGGLKQNKMFGFYKSKSSISM